MGLLLSFFVLVLALLLFGFTVFIHELGHFLAARALGLKVLTFSIGFGKAIVRWERGGIEYKIGWMPFGGYVALPQLDPEGMERIQGGAPQKLPPVSPWKKIIVAFAGPLGNVLFALVLAWSIFLGSSQPILEEQTATVGMVDETSAAYKKGIRSGDVVVSVNGTPVQSWTDFAVESVLGEENNWLRMELLSGTSNKTVELELSNVEETGQVVDGLDPAIPCLLGMVEKDSAADQAGVQPNDLVVEFDGRVINDWFQFVDRVQDAKAVETPMVVERDGERIDLTITPVYNEEYERVMIGVRLGSFRQRPSDQLKGDATMIFRVLKGLVTPAESGKVAKNLQGPVGIFGILMAAIQTGLWTTLGFLRLININLAILNLLPVPVLDGGHILFSLWEGITRRKVHARMQMILIQLCAFLLIGAMLIITFNDLDRKLHISDFFSGLIPGIEQGE
jgi:regulator of sigma E protease